MLRSQALQPALGHVIKEQRSDRDSVSHDCALLILDAAVVAGFLGRGEDMRYSSQTRLEDVVGIRGDGLLIVLYEVEDREGAV